MGLNYQVYTMSWLNNDYANHEEPDSVDDSGLQYAESLGEALHNINHWLLPSRSLVQGEELRAFTESSTPYIHYSFTDCKTGTHYEIEISLYKSMKRFPGKHLKSIVNILNGEKPFQHRYLRGIFTVSDFIARTNNDDFKLKDYLNKWTSPEG